MMRFKIQVTEISDPFEGGTQARPRACENTRTIAG